MTSFQYVRHIVYLTTQFKTIHRVKEKQDYTLLSIYHSLSIPVLQLSGYFYTKQLTVYYNKKGTLGQATEFQT